MSEYPRARMQAILKAWLQSFYFPPLNNSPAEDSISQGESDIDSRCTTEVQILADVDAPSGVLEVVVVVGHVDGPLLGTRRQLVVIHELCGVLVVQPHHVVGIQRRLAYRNPARVVSHWNMTDGELQSDECYDSSSACLDIQYAASCMDNMPVVSQCNMVGWYDREIYSRGIVRDWGPTVLFATRQKYQFLC